jgi:hypothetical protein
MTSSDKAVNNGRVKPKPKHITSACLNCRKKKIKCDGITPRCSHCVLYSQECVFRSGADKRKIASKDRLAALELHAQQLESLLRANGIAVPEFRPEAFLSRDTNGHRNSNGGLVDGKKASKSGFSSYTTGMNQNVDDIEWKSSTDSSGNTDPFEDQLSGRMGSLQIAEDGQLRFYGATSNLNILHNGPLSVKPSGSRCVNEIWQDILNTAGVGQLVDWGLEEHLLKLYFCWEDPSIHVVDEELYFRARAKWKQGDFSSGIYSEVLTNAM